MGYLAEILGVADVRFLATVTTVCAKRTDTPASVERMWREPDRVISPEWLARGSASPLSARAHSACVHPPLSINHCLRGTCIRISIPAPPGAYVFTPWLSVLCMRSKAWLAALGLLAHADVTKNSIFSMGPKLRYPAVYKYEPGGVNLQAYCMTRSASS